MIQFLAADNCILTELHPYNSLVPLFFGGQLGAAILFTLFSRLFEMGGIKASMPKPTYNED